MELTPASLARIQELIQANFAGRDELYAAAQSLDNQACQQVCRRLAAFLAGHAAELQQIVAAQGDDPVGPRDVESLARAMLELARENRGQAGVLDVVAEGEQNLKEDYEQAIEDTSQPRVENVLRRQRDQVEFGEQVLRGMGRPVDHQPPREENEADEADVEDDS